MTSKEAEDALKDILSTVIYHFADENDIMRKKAWSAVMNLEEAVKAEGVAEGVEQEAAKIVHCYECVGGDEHTPEKDQCMLWGEGKDCYCSRGKRVLAPTKERP